MTKVRVHELAKELGMENKDLLERLGAIGIAAKSQLSVLEPSDADKARRALDKNAPQVPKVEERIRPTVVRRKAKVVEVEEAPPAPPAPEPEKVIQAAPPKPVHVAESRAEQAESSSAVSSSPAEPQPTPPASSPSAVSSTQEPAPEAPRAREQEQSPREQQHEPQARPAIAPPRRELTPVDGESIPPRMGENRSSTPAPAADRFAHFPLPPGVTRRGNNEAPAAARLSEADRARIVAEHMASRPPAPRREIRGAKSIGPAARPQARLGKKKGPIGGVKRPMMSTQVTMPSDKKRVIRIEDQIQVQALAHGMSVKVTEVLMKLMQMGMSGVHINSTLDADTASLLANEFHYEVENVKRSDDEIVGDARGTFTDSEGDRETRAPIVTVMGHVDHGKTSLLDRIRSTKVAAGEAGGITQHIGAYRVDTERGPIVFLDTPGHEAFTSMRARGAQATDIVILVVAADDGVMPQTREAAAHAKAAGVPIVVAINKIDKPGAKLERVLQELAGEGLQSEEWGGDTPCIAVSAHTGEGIDKLLENVLVQAEVLALESNVKIPAEGVVLEAYLDRGRGPVANVLIRNGTLRAGDYVVAGAAWGRVRALTDDRGKSVRVAGPATPVEVLGLQELPSAGDLVHRVTDQKKAQEVAEARRKVTTFPVLSAARGLDQLQAMLSSGEVHELKLVLKADMQGSVEALIKSLLELSTEKVKVNVIHSGVGGITESDITLARASNAIVMGFNVRPQGKAAALAKSEGVDVRSYSIIYEAIDEVKLAMAGLLSPTLVEKDVGEASVREVFSIPKIGVIAGCMVTDGKILRSGKVRLVRDGIVVWSGSVGSLRRFKDDLREVTNGFECGIGLAGYNDIKVGDVIQCFEVEQVAASLN